MWSLFHAYVFSFLFLFFKQKTAYEMRISDWSSDVCSSDLPRRRACAAPRPGSPPAGGCGARCAPGRRGRGRRRTSPPSPPAAPARCRCWRSPSRGGCAARGSAGSGGRRGDRESVVQGKRGAVRVDLGGRLIMNKQKRKKK